MKDKLIQNKRRSTIAAIKNSDVKWKRKQSNLIINKDNSENQLRPINRPNFQLVCDATKT